MDVEGLLSESYLYPIFAAWRNCFDRMTMKVFCYLFIKEHHAVMKILFLTLRGWFCAARDANLHC